MGSSMLVSPMNKSTSLMNYDFDTIIDSSSSFVSSDDFFVRSSYTISLIASSNPYFGSALRLSFFGSLALVTLNDYRAKIRLYAEVIV